MFMKNKKKKTIAIIELDKKKNRVGKKKKE